ncbi:hypothetical protein B0J14DRAFT_683261 [Halenospora varia]|nr:hypothetical protein B0J14DRAFT_683261 [Halenospora varia]
MRRLMPLFSGLEHYSKAIEVLCNGTPYLPWLWAPIKLILKVASDYVEAIKQIIRAYSRISESLTRFRVLDATFRQNANFQQTVGIFSDLPFLQPSGPYIQHRLSRSSTPIFFGSTNKHTNLFDEAISCTGSQLQGSAKTTRHEYQIDKEANAYDIVEARDTRKKLETWRQETLTKLAREEEEQTASQLQTISTWLKLDETDQLAIFDKVSTEGAKYPETCGWILKNPTMVSWLRTRPENPFVWLQGNPGTGKSVIIGQLVNFLRASQSSLVVTHFWTYSYASSTQYDKILRPLLFQLVHADDDLIAHSYWEYVVGKKMTSVAALEQLLTTVVTTLLGEPGQSQVRARSFTSSWMDLTNLKPKSGCYERILTNIIANFDARSVDRMRQILGWIAFARRPLRKIEFRSALSFSARDPTVNEPGPSYIFDIYFQTPRSKILIIEDNVIREHGSASIICLLSGLEVFQPDYPSSARSLRVLKGLHGFYVYANEYWVDYILSVVTSQDALSQPSLLSLVVNDLSGKLDSLSESSNALDNEDLMPSEMGLDLLKGYKGLYASARAALKARSRKGLGDEIGKGGSAVGLEQVKELSNVLANYQANIKSLLLVQEFPGVTPKELELFKREFRTSAYTCRQKKDTESGSMAAASPAGQPEGGEGLSGAHPVFHRDPTRGALSHQGIQGVLAQIQPPHAHTQTNSIFTNGIVTNGTDAQPQRFHKQVSQAQTSSPIVRNGTSHSHSSPTVNNMGNVPMNQSASSVGGSYPCLGSVVQQNHHLIGALTAQGIASQRSQQSHTRTPPMLNWTPIVQYTPLNRQMIQTTRVSQGSSLQGPIGQTLQVTTFIEGMSL